MSRVLTLAGVGATMLTAFSLYAVKHETRLLDQTVGRLQIRIERAQAEIAVLAAERANLVRAERIEPLAREHLGLGPTQPDQLANVGEVPWREEAVKYLVAHAGRPVAAEPPADEPGTVEEILEPAPQTVAGSVPKSAASARSRQPAFAIDLVPDQPLKRQ